MQNMLLVYIQVFRILEMLGQEKMLLNLRKKKILEQNRANNGGVLKSDGDGRILNPAKKSIKGQPADLNQAEIDHVVPKSKGGTNENSNLQVLSKEENLKKSNNIY